MCSARHVMNRPGEPLETGRAGPLPALPANSTSEVDTEVQLHFSTFGRPGDSSVVGAGERAVGIVPADEVERVVDVHAKLSAQTLLDGEGLAQGNGLRLLRKS